MNVFKFFSGNFSHSWTNNPQKKTVTERTFLLNMHHLVNAQGLEPRTT